MIKQITRAYIRRYSDSGQETAYVEWIDNRGKAGRTEGPCQFSDCIPIGGHMQALFERAIREGIKIECETW